MRKVRVRKDHPAAPLWTLLLVLITLTLYLLTLAMQKEPVAKQAAAPAVTIGPERVTEDVEISALNAYLIQLGACDSAEEARVEAARYVQRGAAGYLLPQGERQLVIGAGYDTMAEAESVQKRLYEDERLLSEIQALGSPALTLRVTAAPVQVDALREAEAHLREQTAAMGQTAFAIDAGEVDAPTARARFSVGRDKTADVLGRLSAVAGDQPGAVASGLIDLLAQLRDKQSQLSSAEMKTTLSFSSKIKYNYIDLRVRHIAFLNSLGA